MGYFNATPSFLLVIKEVHGHAEHGPVEAVEAPRVDNLINLIANRFLELGLLHHFPHLVGAQKSLGLLIKVGKYLCEPLEISLLNEPRGLGGIGHHFLTHHLLLLHHDLLLALHHFFLLSLVDRRDQRMYVVKGI